MMICVRVLVVFTVLETFFWLSKVYTGNYRGSLERSVIMLLLPNKSELRSPVALSLSLFLSLCMALCAILQDPLNLNLVCLVLPRTINYEWRKLHSLICTVCVVIQIFLNSISATHTKNPTILYFNCACVYLHNQTVGKYQRTKRKWRFY